MAGKGSKRRPYDRKKFDGNYDQIDWSNKEYIKTRGGENIRVYGPDEGPEEGETDIWAETEWEAEHTKCPDCGAKYEVVRPGKTQPSCDCEFICKKCGGRIEFHVTPLMKWPGCSGYFCANCGPYDDEC